MRARLVTAGLLLAGVAGLAAYRCAFAVDETEYVMLTSFGRPLTLLGDSPGETGLHWRWPWQSALRVDRRLQVLEPAAREVMTQDKKNLEVAACVVWRVSDPARFLRAARTPGDAASRLEERAAAAVSEVLSRYTLDALASTDPGVWKLDEVDAELIERLRTPTGVELGVEVLEARLRRFNHPLEVRPAVFELIRSERRQVAATLRAEGEAQFTTLTSQADRERDSLLSRARADAERSRATAEAEAIRTLNAAHSRDPTFFQFLRTLETYRSILDERATVVLSAASPLLRLLVQGPDATLLDDQPAGAGEKAP